MCTTSQGKNETVKRAYVLSDDIFCQLKIFSTDYVQFLAAWFSIAWFQSSYGSFYSKEPRPQLPWDQLSMICYERVDYS